MCTIWDLYIFPSKIFPISLTSVHQAATLLPWPFGLLISAASFTLLHTSEMWRPWLQTLLRRRCTMVAQSQNYSPCLAFKIFSGKVHDFLSFLGWHIKTSDQDFRSRFQRAMNEDFKISFLIVLASSRFNVIEAEVVEIPTRLPLWRSSLTFLSATSVLWGSFTVLWHNIW